ncbi:putative TPR repeat-containing protein [Desulfosarcina cetonica]|uniref:tetratricopeptide repeat protein n=1 Tax=Desulfosarcina cetonica TaxID=90730 RepID=UPI0006CFE4AA|nr:tetratricopeptide repeat protein [Desulfosarcina cetonica]VTR65317.1 putative TPR repeat-containing protein [Desulfosarcina cetonica]
MDGIATILQNSLYPTTQSSIFDEKDGTDLLAALVQQQNGLETLSNQFLQTGIDQYLKKDYEEAVKSFEAAIAIAPQSSYNGETTQYLSQTYLKLEKTDKAIETYEKAVAREPSNGDLHSALAQLLYSEDRYDEAVQQYRAAMELNPSATTRYAYGESLLKVNNYTEAEIQFNQVKRLDPESYAGDYGLGKMYAQSGDKAKAIEHFEKALKLDPEFYDAYAEIGYAYADDGEIESARAVAAELEEKDENLASLLGYYIDEKEPPRIAFALAESSFPYRMSKGYSVSSIDSYLENAGAELSMTMKFIFSKGMDPASIENRFNWQLSRASSSNIAETYNFGDTIPATEINLDPYPDYVLYDKDSQVATVGFTLRQNETADGTIDPSHIVFKFDGKDVFGVSMDSDGDEYSGFSGTA